MKTPNPNQVRNILCLTTLLFSTLLTHCLSEHCHPQDKKALLQLKEGFNNPWVFHTWDRSTDCCEDWNGLECDPKTGRVVKLQAYFGGTDLAGPIPQAIGDLPCLDVLWWHKSPNLTGPIPQSITKLQRLRFLVINWANLSGPVPGFLSELQSLENIDFSFNNFSGPIPSSLSNLPKLTGLQLDRNKLTGPVPHSFGQFRGPNFYLRLSHNQLSGPIPASLGDKQDFNFIDLSRNRLEGDAIPLFGAGKNVTRVIDLSRNLLEFDLSEVGFPKSLTTLDLSHNKIFGRVPAGLTGIEHLYGLNVSYNRLCGEIPVGGALQGFDETAYFHNRCLCGPPLTKSCKK